MKKFLCGDLACRLGWLALLVASGYQTANAAADYTFNKSVEFSLLLTDNADQTDINEITDTSLTFKPSVELVIDGNRFDSRVRGEVELFTYDRTEADDIIDPRIFARTRGTLIDNLLFLDANFSITKVLSEDDVFRLTPEDDSILRLRINPFLEQNYGDFASLRISYRFQTRDESLDGSFENSQNSADFFFGREPALGGLVWGLGGNYDLDKSPGDNFAPSDRLESSSVYGLLGAPIGRTLLLQVTAGTEKNDFPGIAEEDRESPLLDVGITWTPSQRTKLIATYSERFFGDGPTFRFTHRSTKSKIVASWLRGLTRTRASLGALNPGLTDGDSAADLGLTSDGNGNNNSILIDNTDPAQLQDQFFVENQIRLEYKLTGRRSDVVVDAIYSFQDELGGSETIETWITRLAFDRHLSDRSTLRFSYNYETVETNRGTNTAALVDDDLNFTENRLGVYYFFKFLN